MVNKQEIKNDLLVLGNDVLSSKNMELEKRAIQHSNVSVFAHSLSVTYLSLYIARKFFKHVDEKSLVRGALLHDFFLYDWHIKDKSHRFHGFIHAKRAYQNALKEFKLNEIEKDIIIKHMFPLNIKPPKYKESLIVCVADKICATAEIINGHTFFSLGN